MPRKYDIEPRFRYQVLRSIRDSKKYVVWDTVMEKEVGEFGTYNQAIITKNKLSE